MAGTDFAVGTRMPPHGPAELLPLCFTSFVAERRGLELEACAALVAEWLEDYEPGPAALAARASRENSKLGGARGHRPARAA